jgi:cytidylate kinase
MAVITISRQYGAGGRTIGERVAQKLKYSFFDNELIQMVSEKAKVSENTVKSFEKEKYGKFQEFISGFMPKRLVDFIRYGGSEMIDEVIYVDLLQDIIRKIADEGNAVIIGRASQYILKEYENVHHVLVVAKRNDRVKFMEKNYDLSPFQADQTVTWEDKRRANLYRKFGKTDYETPHHYHLILNMSKLNVDTAVELICEMVN